MKFLSYDLLWINVFSQQKKPPHSSGDQGWVIKVYETQVNAVPGLQKVPANVQGPNAARYLGEGTFWWIQSYFISTIYTYHRSCVSDNAQVLHNCTKIAVQKACNKWILFRTSEMAQRKHWPGERWFWVNRTSLPRTCITVREILRKTGIPKSSIVHIIRKDLQLKCVKRRRERNSWLKRTALLVSYFWRSFSSLPRTSSSLRIKKVFIVASAVKELWKSVKISPS